MEKKGFTLVELLAVIVILGVILLIAVPKVLEAIDNSKLSSFAASSKLIAAEAEREYVKRTVLETLNQESDPITCNDVTNISSDYENCDITFDSSGVAYVSVYGTNNFESMYCLNTTKETSRCNGEVEVYEESILNGAYPRLADGMIPVTIANDGTVTTINPTSSSWYSYTNKIWANVVLVKETGTKTREYYESNYGVVVPEADILAYLVWIPRYKYTLFNVEGAASTYTGGCSNSSYYSPSTCTTNGGTWTDPTCTANCPQSIAITFEEADTVKSIGTTNGSALTHPAFTYNGVELNGIWAAKFEMTQGTALNIGTTNPTIKPSITTWASQIVSVQFTTSLLLGTNTVYGLSAESRMSKNSEWGAISYLSHSQYGINTEIRLNNYWGSGIKTGCGALTAYAASTSTTCENAFGTVNSYPQSTTGNISGIFDISGGATEYQMGSYTNASNDLYSGFCSTRTSGFNGKYGNPGATYAGCDPNILVNTTGLDYPNVKYYKIYNTTGWQSNVNNLGDALGETNGWYKDSNTIVSSDSPWFMRGGVSWNGILAGPFGFTNGYGSSNPYFATRIIVITN